MSEPSRAVDTPNDVLVDLCEENPDIPWAGSGGLLDRAACDIAQLRSMLRRAMDLANEIKTYLHEHPV